MKNDKWRFVVRTSDFYLSLVIGHWSFFICHFLCCAYQALLEGNFRFLRMLAGKEIRKLEPPLLPEDGQTEHCPGAKSAQRSVKHPRGLQEHYGTQGP